MIQYNLKLAIALAFLIVLSTSSGCQIFSRMGLNKTKIPQAPIVFNGQASKEQIMAVVNANSSRVNQLDTQVKITIPGLPPVSGDLAIQRPNRLRLQAGLIGTNGIDVGSNDQAFWVWQKIAMGGQQPTMFYARHQDYLQSQARQTIPIDPNFLMDALGLMSFSNQMIHDGPYQRNDSMFEIRSRTDQQGRGPMRTTVVDSRYGYVLEQHTFENGRLTASAYSQNYRFYPDQNVSLPQTVRVRAMPGTAQELSLTIEASPYNLNNLYGDPRSLFAMPEANGTRKIDISRGGQQVSQRNNYSSRKQGKSNFRFGRKREP